MGNRTSSTDGNSSDADNNNSNDVILQLELTDEIRQQEIVTSYAYDIEIDCLCLELNHKYSKKKITSPIESKWPTTMALFMKELERKGIDKRHITMLCDVIDNAANNILK